MTTARSWSATRAATAGGLAVGALGIAILWASGVPFPFAVPPGMVILAGGSALVALSSRRWAPGVGALLGLFITVGFLVSPGGVGNLLGDAGAGAAVGQGVQQAGVLTALVAGAAASRGAYRRQAARTHAATPGRS
ncbi:hypothetical protein [Peterkaempfera sp. SMS 1(5)a]|uniref:hypothetical protein n=1 Tax=Peterkaempfera podocarpi TaxID=3232308 RepID=UPI00366AD4A0